MTGQELAGPMGAIGQVVVAPVLRWMSTASLAGGGRRVYYAQPAALALLLATAGVESSCRYRRQHGGPARGLWQFEREGGLAGVRKVAPAVWAMALQWGLPADLEDAHEALATADIPACILARGLFWTLPEPLPQLDGSDHARAYRQYLAAWRPGRPCGPDRFAAAWRLACDLAQAV